MTMTLLGSAFFLPLQDFPTQTGLPTCLGRGHRFARLPGCDFLTPAVRWPVTAVQSVLRGGLRSAGFGNL